MNQVAFALSRASTRSGVPASATATGISLPLKTWAAFSSTPSASGGAACASSMVTRTGLPPAASDSAARALATPIGEAAPPGFREMPALTLARPAIAPDASMFPSHRAAPVGASEEISSANSRGSEGTLSPDRSTAVAPPPRAAVSARRKEDSNTVLPVPRGPCRATPMMRPPPAERPHSSSSPSARNRASCSSRPTSSCGPALDPAGNT